MDIILKGILTGLFLSVFVGATFFMLIETSLTRGFKAALWFDMGVVACDTCIIFAVYFFTSWISRFILQNDYFSIAGGLVFMGFGINYIFMQQRDDTPKGLKTRHLRLFMNGFFINLMNPSVILFWLGTMALTLTEFKFTGRETLLYYAVALGIMALLDIVKAFFASRLSHILNARVLKILYVTSGILMIGMGFYIILKDFRTGAL